MQIASGTGPSKNALNKLNKTGLDPYALLSLRLESAPGMRGAAVRGFGPHGQEVKADDAQASIPDHLGNRFRGRRNELEPRLRASIGKSF